MDSSNLKFKNRVCQATSRGGGIHQVHGEIDKFALKMMNFVHKHDEFWIENDEFCIENDEFCIKGPMTSEVCINIWIH